MEEEVVEIMQEVTDENFEEIFEEEIQYGMSCIKSK